MDHRLCEYTGKPNEVFSGMAVALLGDQAQINPVGGNDLWSDKPKVEDGLFGSLLYRQNFKHVIELVEVKRVLQNESAHTFLSFLTRSGMATVLQKNGKW